MSSDRAFCGTQTDHFALVADLSPGSRVCLLGAGIGAAIQAIVATRPELRVTAVDNDAALLRSTAAVFAAQLPGVTFEPVPADAFEFCARAAPAAFDAVCVDLFEADRYPARWTGQPFWSAVSRMTDPSGPILVNTWGFPNHLRPFAGATPHRVAASALRRIRTSVHTVGQLRNQTLIATAARPAVPRGLGTHSLTGVVDRLVYRNIAARAGATIAATDDPGDAGRTPLSVDAINRTFAQRMAAFVAELECYGAPAKPSSDSNRQYLLDLLGDRVTTPKLLALMLEAGDDRASFVPAYLASYRLDGHHELEWLVDWFCDELPALGREFPAWTSEHVLPVLLAILANPIRPLAATGAARLVDAVAGVRELPAAARSRETTEV